MKRKKRPSLPVPACENLRGWSGGLLVVVLIMVPWGNRASALRLGGVSWTLGGLGDAQRLTPGGSSLAQNCQAPRGKVSPKKLAEQLVL